MHERQDPEQILGRLRSSGLRVTAPRRAVVRALAEADPHPSADDIAAAANQIDSEVHRSTVYRTLDTLTEIGIVSHVHLGHGGAIYHLADDTDLHIICQSCEAVAHVDARVLDGAATSITSATGFTIDPGHFAIQGTCPECALSD